MKKFKFTLQTVHKVREIRQEKESLALSELQAEVDRAVARVAEIEKQRSEAMENYSKRLNSGQPLNAMELELNSNHFNSLNRLQQTEESRAEQKKEACVEQGKTLVAAMREAKVTGRLYETQKAVHETESARREQNTIDDMITENFARHMTHPK